MKVQPVFLIIVILVLPSGQILLIGSGNQPVSVVEPGVKEPKCSGQLPSPPFTSISIVDSYGFMIDMKPWICGVPSNGFQNQCFSYNKTWEPEFETDLRGFASTASRVEGYEYWLAGGVDVSTNSLLSSSQVFRNGEVFPGPELQKPLAHQCAIMLSEAESFIAGGIIDMDSGTVTRAASFYHWDIAIHTMLPDMPTPRHGHSCSLLNIEDSDKPVIVVLGGLGEQKEFLNSVDVFSVELKVWATLKEPAPSYFVNSALVAAERNNLLYVIGGFGAGENGQPERHSQVYCFDGDTGMWAQLNNSVPVTNDINDLSQRTFAMKLPEKFCPI